MFFDTYALVAAFLNDARYAALLKGSHLTTGFLNLAEAYTVMRRHGKSREQAERLLAPLEARARDAGWRVLRDAAEARVHWASRGRKWSLVDAIGYTHARSLGVPFLTGDPAFRGIPGVQFVRESKATRRVAPNPKKS